MRLKEWGDTKMEDVKDLLGRLLNRVDGSGISDEDLNRQINAIYSIYASAVGSEQIIVQSRFNALKYIHDENPRIRLIGMERLILESREYTHQPADDEIPAILDKLEDKLAEMLARQAVEKQLEEKIADRLDERHQEYVNEIRQEIIEEEMGEGESPANRKKMEKLEAMDKVKLTSTVMQVVRPQSLSEIVGQDRAVKALASRIASPYPQHLILYGPPGVGKTTAARLVLDEAKKLPFTAFGENAPFVECDGTTLRWDSRDMTNPLIGSVHDPIYQGAQRDLADEGIPEPKPGLVTDAHGGVLFIDEIHRLNRSVEEILYSAMEDFALDLVMGKGTGATSVRINLASFTLIGATTRPGSLSAPLRDRFLINHHMEFYEPDELKHIITRAAGILNIEIEESGAA